MRKPTRKALEAELINATLIASRQILSCMVINRIIRLAKLKSNMTSAGLAAITISLVAFIFSWLINLIGQQPNSINYNWPLGISAFLTGLAFFVVKTLHDNLLPPNRVRAAKLPNENDGVKA